MESRFFVEVSSAEIAARPRVWVARSLSDLSFLHFSGAPGGQFLGGGEFDGGNGFFALSAGRGGHGSGTDRDMSASGGSAGLGWFGFADEPVGFDQLERTAIGTFFRENGSVGEKLMLFGAEITVGVGFHGLFGGVFSAASEEKQDEKEFRAGGNAALVGCRHEVRETNLEVKSEIR